MLPLSRTVRANAPITAVAGHAGVAPGSKRLTKRIGVCSVARELPGTGSTKSDPIVGSSCLNPASKGLPLVAHVAAASKLRPYRRRCTIILAAVTIRLVSVVAAFDPSTNLSVTAPRHSAVVQASIGLCIVAIIAGFDTRLNQPITATRDDTINKTSVGLNVVPIIASLDTLLNLTIAAAC